MGTSLYEGEYAALGANFAERNVLTDEALGAIRQAWQGESLTRDGRGFHVRGNTMLPTPVQQPNLPIDLPDWLEDTRT